MENLYSLKETKFIIEMVLAFILMFSLLVLVPLGLFGVLVLGYLSKNESAAKADALAVAGWSCHRRRSHL